MRKPFSDTQANPPEKRPRVFSMAALCLLLAAAMAFPAGCKKEETQSSSKNASSISSAESTEAGSTESTDDASAPENTSAAAASSKSTPGGKTSSKSGGSAIKTKNLGGREIVIASLWYRSFFPEYGESESGDKVLARMEKLQSANNIKVKYRPVSSIEQFTSEYQAAMASGTYYADIVESQLWYARNWIRSGYAVDLSMLPSFGINQDKYLKAYSNLTKYDGKIYGTNFTSWYHNYPTVNYGIMMANLSLLKRKNQPDIYKLIDENKWTWKAFRDICLAVKETQNGRTTLWGCANDVAQNALWSTGKRFIGWDSSAKRWSFGYANTSSYNAMQLAIDMYNTDRTVNISSDQNYGFRELFCKGKAAFVNVEVEWLSFGENKKSWISGLQDDFGFIPFPLSDDNSSKKYAGALGGNTRIFFIPSTAKNPDDVGLIFNQLTEPLEGTTANSWQKEFKENALRGNANSFKWYWQLTQNGEYDMQPDMGVLEAQPFWLTLRAAVVEKNRTPAEVVALEQEPANRYLNQTVNSDPKMLK